MNKVPIVIREAKNGEVFTREEQLETEQDVTKKIVRSRLINKYIKNNMKDEMSLCGNCTLGPTQCPKVRDISKRTISEYPFILDGYQVIDMLEVEKDKKYVDDESILQSPTRTNRFGMERFIVFKCTKYRGTR